MFGVSETFYHIGGVNMRLRFGTILAIAILCSVPTASWADLAPYSQDFEGLLVSDLDQPAQVALANDGWRFFVNVFPNPDTGFPGYYNYSGAAPNGGFGGPAISAVIAGEGSPWQAEQQLSIFSDYNNGNHADGALIEVNVFQEQVVGAADVGSTWVFEFDFRDGNIEGGTTALAFIKTLNPAAGYALTNFITADMTSVPTAWGTTLLSIYIDASLEGQILQFGFLNTASYYEGSAIFYDNVNFIDLIDLCPERVTLCHAPPGNPGLAHTITVGASAVPAHLSHGDSLGRCGPPDSGSSRGATERGFRLDQQLR